MNILSDIDKQILKKIYNDHEERIRSGVIFVGALAFAACWLGVAVYLERIGYILNAYIWAIGLPVVSVFTVVYYIKKKEILEEHKDILKGKPSVRKKKSV